MEINMRKTVLIPITNGTEEIEAIAATDALRRAGAEVTLASVDKDLHITASRQTKIVADKFLNNCINETYDLIYVPGGPGAEHLRDCPALINMLKQQQQSGRLYAAICAAPVVVLQHHGLLNGLKATCHPSLFDKLQNCQKEQVVVDQNCATSQGPGTTLIFAKKLIELLFNKETAENVAKGMVIVS
jgi:4-methyl-5(b-hydroxyethyl)-thiazole monophosphate biosynthesis